MVKKIVDLAAFRKAAQQRTAEDAISADLEKKFVARMKKRAEPIENSYLYFELAGTDHIPGGKVLGTVQEHIDEDLHMQYHGIFVTLQNGIRLEKLWFGDFEDDDRDTLEIDTDEPYAPQEQDALRYFTEVLDYALYARQIGSSVDDLIWGNRIPDPEILNDIIEELSEGYTISENEVTSILAGIQKAIREQEATAKRSGFAVVEDKPGDPSQG